MKELPILSALTSGLEEADALDPVIDRVSDFTSTVPREVREVLHGEPAGHTLHPALILWIGSAILDFVPGSKAASTTLVGAGVLTVAPAVITGLADWSLLPEKRQRRVGLVHAASNTVATTLYALSFVQRTRGKHGSGKLLGLAGLAVVGFSGYLGGHLAYRQGASVETEADEQFIAVTPS
jgi:uncharacterized membrane protein